MGSSVFSFPDGAAGAGLGLLRLSSVSSLLSAASASAAPTSWVTVASVLLAIGLCVGFRTRWLALLSGLMIVLVMRSSAPPALLALYAINAVVLALTGPGAYSLDARLFGRKTIVLRGDAGTIE